MHLNQKLKMKLKKEILITIPIFILCLGMGYLMMIEPIKAQKLKMENENNLLNFTSDDVKQTPQIIEAALVKTELVNAKDVYGKKSKEDQKLVKFYIENDTYKINLTEHFTYYPKEKLTDNCKLGKFLLAYGNLDVQKINLMKNKDGFYKILLEKL